MMEKRVKAAKKKPPKGAVNCFLFFTQFFYPIFNGISNDLFSLNRYAENSISAPRDFSQVNRGSSRSLRYIEMTFYLFFVEESLSIIPFRWNSGFSDISYGCQILRRDRLSQKREYEFFAGKNYVES